MANPLAKTQDIFNLTNPESPSNVPWDWEVSNSTDDESPTLAPEQTANVPWANSGIGRDSRTAWWGELGSKHDDIPTDSDPGNGQPGQVNANPYGSMTVGGGNNYVENNALVGGRIRFKSFNDDHAGDVGSTDMLSEIASLAAAGNVNVPSNAQVAQAILLGRMNGTA